MGNQQSEIPMNNEEFRNKTFQKMDKEIRVKLSKGVNWNLKIIIKGERKTGKTCLFNRLQGKTFIEEYIPTNQIQTTHINWSYKNSCDNVKVEVWDVVDSSLDNTNQSTSEGLTLDARTVNVYRGANAVIMPFNPSERKTWEYIVEEVPNVPLKTYILILANFKDISANISVTKSEIESFISKQNHHIYLLETSMRNCFGLRGLKSFINLPFLNMQKEYYNEMLNDTLKDMNLAEEEFRMLVEDDTYENYLKLLSTRKPKQDTQSPNQQESKTDYYIPKEVSTETTEKEKSIKIKEPTKSTKLWKYNTETPKKNKGFISSLFSTKKSTEIKKDEVISTQDTVDELLKLRETAKKGGSQLKSPDEFSPEIDESWLKDSEINKPTNVTYTNNKYNEDSDEDTNVQIIADEVEVEIDYDFDFDLKPLKKETKDSDSESVKTNEEFPEEEIKLDTIPIKNQYNEENNSEELSEQRVENPTENEVDEEKDNPLADEKSETVEKEITLPEEKPSSDDDDNKEKKEFIIEEPELDDIDDYNIPNNDDRNDTSSSISDTEKNVLDSFVPQDEGIDDDFWNDEPTNVRVAVLYNNEDENSKSHVEIEFDENDIYDFKSKYSEEEMEEEAEGDNGFYMEEGYEAL